MPSSFGALLTEIFNTRIDTGLGRSSGMVDRVSDDQIDQAARGMLTRYSPEVAIEMAGHHAYDYAEGTPRRKYWTRVKARLIELTGGR